MTDLTSKNSLLSTLAVIGSLVGVVQAATVVAPAAIIDSIGSDAAGHYGVHYINAAPVFGSFTQDAGTVTANDGDDLQLTIRPAGGQLFQLDTTDLNRFVVTAYFEQINPVFGGSIFRNNTGSLTLNNILGGTAPSVVPINNINNRPFVMTPGNVPTGFFGQVSAVATHSNGEPVSFGSGVITFESITLNIPNVADLNWEENSLDSLSVYFGNATNTSPLSFVPVPEPSTAVLLFLGAGLAVRRRR